MRISDWSSDVCSSDLAAADGVACAITDADWTRWASATFTGAQHRLTLSGAFTPALDDWLTALPDREFALPGHLVADLTILAMRASHDRIEAERQAPIGRASCRERVRQYVSICVVPVQYTINSVNNGYKR